MLLRRLLKIYLRNFIPLTRRLFQLVFRSKRTPVLEIIEFDNGRGSTLYQRTVQIKCRTNNAILLSINGNVVPIVEDGVPMKLNIPVSTNTESIVITLTGLFSSVRKSLPVNAISTQVNTPRIHSSVLVKESKIRSNIAMVLTPNIALKKTESFSIRSYKVKEMNVVAKGMEVRLKEKELIVTTQHITELENQLKEQTINYE